MISVYKFCVIGGIFLTWFADSVLFSIMVKTEFQDGGAAHVHGVLWIKLHEVEKLCRLQDKTLVSLSCEEKLKVQGKFSEPFKGISTAFKKFRIGAKLTLDE